jgi:outer membrane protein OmpA-like peptidoglycan-associated protein
MNDEWSADHDNEWSPEGFWASYSDVMAAVLMVFALASLYMSFKVMEVTEPMQRWNETSRRLCRQFTEEFAGVRGLRCDAGALVFEMDEEWFEFNDVNLKDGGRDKLRNVIPSYLRMIREDHEFWDQVELVEVGGHADSRVSSGRRGSNLWISSERARQVMDFLLTDESTRSFREDFYDRGVVVGYGDSHIPEACETAPYRDLYLSTGECAPARRVEIKTRPRYQDVIEELSRILAGPA